MFPRGARKGGARGRGPSGDGETSGQSRVKRTMKEAGAKSGSASVTATAAELLCAESLTLDTSLAAARFDELHKLPVLRFEPLQVVLELLDIVGPVFEVLCQQIRVYDACLLPELSILIAVVVPLVLGFRN